jgi:hypothetical protein
MALIKIKTLLIGMLQNFKFEIDPLLDLDKDLRFYEYGSYFVSGLHLKITKRLAKTH